MKRKFNVQIIAVVVVICICIDSLLVVCCNLQKKKIYSLRAPMEIADEYVQPKYGFLWNNMGNIFCAQKDREGDYVIGVRTESPGSAYCKKSLKEKGGGVHCETVIDKREDKDVNTLIRVRFSYYYGIIIDNDILVVVAVYKEDKGYWEDEYIMIDYKNGEYIPDNANLEKLTGMKAEEFVEVAENGLKGYEGALYEIKEWDWAIIIGGFFFGMLLVNGTGIYVIVHKGIQREG